MVSECVIDIEYRVKVRTNVLCSSSLTHHHAYYYSIVLVWVLSPYL